jgi:predicted nucleic acid-binding protein
MTTNNTTKRILTLDSNIFVGAVKGDEPYQKKCLDIIKLIPDAFILSEPSIVYQEVCGTIARRVGAAWKLIRFLIFNIIIGFQTPNSDPASDVA